MNEKNNKKILFDQYNIDQLTKINTRKSFEDNVSKMISESKNYDRSLFITIDLDQFSEINFSHGHFFGDKLLIKTVSIINYFLTHNNLETEDYTFGRLNGDEFGVFIKNIQKYNLDELLPHLSKDLEKIQVNSGWGDVFLSCSMGVSVYPEHGVVFNDLLKSSTIALKHSKELHLNKFKIFNYNDADFNNIKNNLYWNNFSKREINSDLLSVYFQPIAKTSASCKNIEISHYECLLRVNENEKWISPYEYILACEKTGKITQVDFFMINKIFEYISILRFRNQLKNYKFSINISGLSFSHPDFCKYIIDKKKEHNINSNSVIFEITETSLIENFERSLKVIDEINELGFSFALDDFGIGFSNFETLKKINSSYVKIDGSFISNVVNDDKDKIIVKAINDIAHAFGQKTVAEFVENSETFELLHSLGIDYVQGYFIDKPEPFSYHFSEETKN
jgi:diguanylate cyclase (GGDEF)-like protein